MKEGSTSGGRPLILDATDTLVSTLVGPERGQGAPTRSNADGRIGPLAEFLSFGPPELPLAHAASGRGVYTPGALRRTLTPEDQ